MQNDKSDVPPLSPTVPAPADIEAAHQCAKRLLAWIGSIWLAVKTLEKAAKLPRARDDSARLRWVAGIIANGQAVLDWAGVIGHAQDWLARSRPIQVSGVRAASYHEALLKLALTLHGKIVDALRSAWLDRQADSVHLSLSEDIPDDLAALWGEGSWEEFVEALLNSPSLGREERSTLSAELDCERAAALRRLTARAKRMPGGGLLAAETPAPAPAPPAPRAEEAAPRSSPVRDEPTAVERAMIIFTRDPNQPVTEIARQAGCDRSLLYRSPTFRRLRQAHAGRLPRGSKSSDGDLEAEEER
jgi:hypothetical protein